MFEEIGERMVRTVDKIVNGKPYFYHPETRELVSRG
jgi:hypothetical protein